MLTISRPLSASQARTYHAEEFSNAKENYYTEGEKIIGEWHGKLAQQWGLLGEVGAEHFERLTEGQHPITGEQLVRHQTAHEYLNQNGEKVKTMEHRAGWDATFSAPKSVSLTALVGRDEHVREAHRSSVSVAIDELERYVQARLGGNLPPETTGKWIAARFEHDSSRPVDGYAAPQLHTHVVFFNLTETQDGQLRPIQPRELYRTQQYATAVYRSELAYRLRELGYEIERGASSQPEIKGYSKGYLEASSPRRRQIEEHLARENRRGARAAQIAAHQTREQKLDISHHEMQARHRVMAQDFGNQPKRVIASAKGKTHEIRPAAAQGNIESAITFAKDRNLEREAVTDERALLRDALKRSMGKATLSEVKRGFVKQIEKGAFIQIEGRTGASAREFTTPETIAYERDTIRAMRDGQGRYPELAKTQTRSDIEQKHSHLNPGQRAAVEQILSSRDQVIALEGTAGAGKTTSLAAIREAAERDGYKVEGFAPTSRAAQKLGEAGVESITLQRHLAQREESRDSQRRLYILDESSLASTKQMNEFLHRLRHYDRVLLVGDVRQHEAVEAGKPYQQLQEAGIMTARLDEIVRQKDPGLKEVVDHLSRGQVLEAMEMLDRQGRIHEIVDSEERLKGIAREYVRSPEGTLVVSPDNHSRQQINEAIHRAMQRAGHVDTEEHKVRALAARQETTAADRRWAGQYEVGQVVRYTKGSKKLGIEAGEYARVERVNENEGSITVKRESGELVSYDPRRLHGVMLYREIDRNFAEGDRIQFTAPNRALQLANRQLGTIEKITANDAEIRLDSGRTLTINFSENRHLDYGYAVTSHSSQGQTADRVLIHIDPEQAGEKLVNRRLAYVAISRGRYDAQIFTNDKTHLAEKLGRDISHRSAIEPGPELLIVNKAESPAQAHGRPMRGYGQGIEF